MNDKILLKLISETVRHLKDAISVNPAYQMIPSYNAILAAAKENYPDDTFLRVLAPLTTDGELVTIAEITALFAQIGIVVEARSEKPYAAP